MRSFTIDHDNNITIYGTRRDALDAAARIQQADQPCVAFSSEEQLADAVGSNMSRLVEIWNSMTWVKPVKKFENRQKAIRRIWQAIQHLAGDDVPANVGAQAPDVAPVEPATSKDAAKPAKAPKADKSAPREGSKQEQAIAMMKRPNGATLPELMAAFGWQAHTVRGFVAGALSRKLGLNVESTKPEGGERTYKIRS